MAVIFDNDKAYLHIPKTGGMWVRRILAENKIKNLIYSNTDYDINTPDGQMVAWNELHHLASLPYEMESKKVFCTIRNPVTWYESFFLFRNHSAKWRWDKKRPLDSKISKDARLKFSLFIDEMIDLYPGGYLGELYQRYTMLAGHYVRIESAPAIIEKLTGKKIKKIPEPVNTRTDPIELDSLTITKITEWERKAVEMFNNCK